MTTVDVCDLIREAADKAILPRFMPGRDSSETASQKEDDSFVTIADSEAEEILTSTLKANSGEEYTILGEEEHGDSPISKAQSAALSTTYGWTIDPLDGTRAYVQGRPHFATMVSEIRDSIVVRSWIYLPVFREMWVTENDRVYLNGELVVPMADSHRRLRGVAYKEAHSPNNEGFLCGRGSGSVGVDYTHMARGVIDFIGHKQPKPWDHFPGAHMITTLGGMVALAASPKMLYSPGYVMPPVTKHSILAASNSTAWAKAASHLYTPSASYFAKKVYPQCTCRIGTLVANPECQIHGLQPSL